MKDQRQRAKLLMEAVREILLRDWDPLGVAADSSAPRDEYEAYVGPIASALLRGDSAPAVASQLRHFEEAQMGLSPATAGVYLIVANKLKGIQV